MVVRRVLALTLSGALGAAALMGIAPAAHAATVSFTPASTACDASGDMVLTSFVGPGDDLALGGVVGCNQFSVTRIGFSGGDNAVSGNSTTTFTGRLANAGRLLATLSRTTGGNTVTVNLLNATQLPSAPVITSAAAGNGLAQISFTPGTQGSSPILRYEVSPITARIGLLHRAPQAQSKLLASPIMCLTTLRCAR